MLSRDAEDQTVKDFFQAAWENELFAADQSASARGPITKALPRGVVHGWASPSREAEYPCFSIYGFQRLVISACNLGVNS